MELPSKGTEHLNFCERFKLEIENNLLEEKITKILSF